MNTTLARCGCPVAAVGMPGSMARRAVESRPCDKPRCRSGLPPKFTDAECESYCRLVAKRVAFSVDLKDKSVLALADGVYYPSLAAADAAEPSR